ncbi:Sorting nexin mvp1 [Agyrium rufum]|nr:Sorting nexin mvp1 [Agyrium rufum]
MSLFGSSPDESSFASSRPQLQSKSSLFDDHPVGKQSNGGDSLFTDDANADGGSPWGLPVSKRASRTDLVKTLLPARDVPESYVDAFDAVLDSGARTGNGISLDAINAMLKSSGISSSEQDKIRNIVVLDQTSGAGVGRGEFNVLLALIGLSQEQEEATLDGVDDRRRKLPKFSIPYLKQIRTAKISENLEETNSHSAAATPGTEYPPTPAPAKSRRFRKDSLDDPEADPWASPAASKPVTREVNNDATPNSAMPTAAKPVANSFHGPTRTTSAFTTHSEAPTSDASGNLPQSESAAGASDGWGGFDNLGGDGGGGGGGGDGFPNGDQSMSNDAGFGSGGGNGNPSSAPRNIGGGKTTGRAGEETVTITVLPEKEGMFMFQHRNYEVKCARKASTVVRRYSDFVWLLDCLHKRYPFRQLPLLPPKTLAVNGRHLSSDITFIEKRRRGLVRFATTLVRHPVLSQEQLVVMFLTVPTELAVWRKQATISVQEEFVGKSLPPGLEDSLSPTLMDTFETVRSGVKRSAETYIGLCNLLERLTKRNQGLASDYLRFSSALKGLTEESPNTYATDTNDVPLLNEGILSAARHLETSQSLLEDEARAWDGGVLEDLKKQRDALVSVREMFDRRDRYSKDHIPQLERRIEANESKLATIRAKPEGTKRPGEQEKVEHAIMNDKQSIVDQHARGVFIKECIRDELIFFQHSQYAVTRLHQDWSQELVKYAELQADNWRAYSEEVENMPMGE